MFPYTKMLFSAIVYLLGIVGQPFKFDASDYSHSSLGYIKRMHDEKKIQFYIGRILAAIIVSIVLIIITLAIIFQPLFTMAVSAAILAILLIMDVVMLICRVIFMFIEEKRTISSMGVIKRS